MWIVAGVLLGLVVLAALAGFHTGPHTHVAAGLLGLVVAVWLVVMVAEGEAAPVLWALLGADVALSAGVGVMAWSALSHPAVPDVHHLASLEAAEGVAVTELAPEGIVRVRGEQWSAVSVNGAVPAGVPVQILRSSGVRLEVWAEWAGGAERPATGDLFRLDQNDLDLPQRQEQST